MMRTLKVIVAVIASTALLLGIGAVAYSAAIPANPRYQKVADIDTEGATCDSIDVEWDASPHADFYVLKYDDDADFTSPSFIRSDLRDRSETISGLDEDERIYVKVAVADSVRHRLSYYSKTVSRATLNCP